MKATRMIPFLAAILMVISLASCGPTYVNGRSGYYGTRPYYGYGARPYNGYYGGSYYRRPPVVVQRRTYVVPQRSYARPSVPNARSGYGGFRGSSGRSRGPR